MPKDANKKTTYGVIPLLAFIFPRGSVGACSGRCHGSVSRLRGWGDKFSVNSVKKGHKTSVAGAGLTGRSGSGRPRH